MRLTAVLGEYKKVGELTKQYSNLPDSYIKKSIEHVFYRTPRLRNYLRRTVKKSEIVFTEDRPWTLQSKMANPIYKKAPTIYVEPIKEWKIFKGDRVELLYGKDKGKQGIVAQVIQERNWVVVEGLNKEIKVMEKESTGPASIRVVEKPLRVTDQISLVDPSDLLPCDVDWRYTEKGERVRVSLRSGRIIPMPIKAQETYDYKTPKTYIEQPKDTPADVVQKVTFEPSLNTFEMEIMKKMNIKEDREPAPVYWY
ncbi:large ribosomal subunit protein uL24m [Planococcus citri]|uniref:large ribosomal subunit protein uL24m n=1 Tax=Planococcus citri TaxID=170843 RepID=UPI0031F95A63